MNGIKRLAYRENRAGGSLPVHCTGNSSHGAARLHCTSPFGWSAMTHTKRDPATGEQYNPETIHAELRLRPPLTGFCYDHLRRELTTTSEGTAALLDNVLTRLETKTTLPSTTRPYPHERCTVAVPILTEPEGDAVRDAFTVADGTCVAPLCAAVRHQLQRRR